MRARPILLCTLAVVACSEPPTAPETETDPPTASLASIELSSPIGTLVAVGGRVALGLTATDTQGASATVSPTWSSSAPDVARVDAAGTVEAVGPGTAEISASADGVTGALELTVVAADLDAIASLLADPFAEGLLASFGDPLQGRLRGAWTACASGPDSGNLTAVVDCIAEARAELSGDAVPEHGPLRALLGLFVDWLERHLALS